MGFQVRKECVLPGEEGVGLGHIGAKLMRRGGGGWYLCYECIHMSHAVEDSLAPAAMQPTVVKSKCMGVGGL